MQQFNSISEFLLQAGTQYRAFDFGRGIRKLDTQQVLALENGTIAAEYPRQNMTWLAFVFWSKASSEQHFLWFVKLPLDERGHVITAHRDQFLAIVIEALGEQFANQQHSEKQLPDNPYCFQPTQQQMADFNAIVKYQFKLKPSEHYQHCLTYLANPSVVDWQTLPLQSIADVMCRHNEQAVVEAMITYGKTYPAPVLQALLSSLENHSLSVRLTEFLLGWATTTEDSHTRSLLLRSTCQSQASGLVNQTITHLLKEPDHHDHEFFVVLAGRHWQLLAEPKTMLAYLSALAAYDSDHDLFISLYSDLVTIPCTRDAVLATLRAPEKSDALLSAIGTIYSSVGR